jgi:MoxR-like ATPase
VNDTTSSNLNDESIKLLERKIYAQIQVMQSVISVMEKKYSFTRMRDLHTAILDEVKKVDPDLQKQIIERLRELHSTLGITQPSRTGFFQRVKDRIAGFFKNK